MKKQKETKTLLNYHINDLKLRQRKADITPKEKKVINACLRMYKFRLGRKS
jgi:hypothetical protein